MKITANENEINDILQTYCKSTVHIANLLYILQIYCTSTKRLQLKQKTASQLKPFLF